MNKNILNKVVYAISSLIVICALFVLADYFGLFGTTIEKRFSFSEIRFRTVDKDTGTPIMNVGVRCFQKNNINGCSRKKSKRVGIVSVNIPVQRAIKKTLLFKKAEEIYKYIEPKMNIMLIHQNYHNRIVTISMEDLYSQKITEKVVEMPPREQLDSEAEEE